MSKRANGEGNVRQRADGRWEGSVSYVDSTEAVVEIDLRDVSLRRGGRVLVGGQMVLNINQPINDLPRPQLDELRPDASVAHLGQAFFTGVQNLGDLLARQSLNR